MTKIYFMRHGQVHNPKKVLYGRLTRFGLDQHASKSILQTAQLLKDKNIKLIFCSPLLRTVRTAKLVSSIIDAKIIKSRLLLEVKNDYQGVSLEHFQSHIEPYMYDKIEFTGKVESVGSIQKRILRFIKNIYKKYPNDTILAISHGDPIMILKMHAKGVSFSWKSKIDQYIKTASVLPFIYKNGELDLIEE